MTGCPFPACNRDAPGRNGVFCADHHFSIQPSFARLILRTRIAMEREADAPTRTYLAEQLDGYCQAAIRRATEGVSRGA